MAADKKKEAKKYVEEATKVKKQAEVLFLSFRATPSGRRSYSIRNFNWSKQSWTWRPSAPSTQWATI
jgi:hypothetical protein